MKNKTKRHIIMLKLQMLTAFGKNNKKADTLRKAGIFRSYGCGGYWHPTVIPTHSDLISIGNNVVVAADVKFFEHDLTNIMLNESEQYGEFNYYKAPITVGNNVMIGGNAIILYNVNIGNNVIVAAGSVVTQDVPDNVVVGGNPARVICTLDEFVAKRKALDNY